MTPEKVLRAVLNYKNIFLEKRNFFDRFRVD